MMYTFIPILGWILTTGWFINCHKRFQIHPAGSFILNNVWCKQKILAGTLQIISLVRYGWWYTQCVASWRYTYSSYYIGQFSKMKSVIKARGIFIWCKFGWMYFFTIFCVSFFYVYSRMASRYSETSFLSDRYKATKSKRIYHTGWNSLLDFAGRW